MKIEFDNFFITDNSNECEKGCKFVKTQMNAKFENDAIKNGASIISLDEAKKLLGIDKDIKIIGITGTNGKTTTAAAIYSALIDLGYGCGLCGTRGAFVNDKRIDEKSLTTMPILTTLSYLKKASEEKCNFFVMEVSSHAIAQNRIEGLNFALKVFTNLSQDHLDYHGSMVKYARVKSSFFADDTPKLINSDDEHIVYNPKEALTYAIKRPATFGVEAYSLRGGIEAVLKNGSEKFELSSDLQGEFNLYNLLAALGAIKMLTKHSCKEISKALSNFAGVEGRVQKICDNPTVIVDFAHTPDGIEKVLDALKDNELIVVFGAGGNRDKTKRPLMGKIVQHYAKYSIVTSDNPRFEEPLDIINDICSGMDMSKNATCEEDRTKAIKMAIDMAKNGEIVVVLGKGDENYQEIKGVKYHYSDQETILNLVKG
ncbi:UDP-N-acetylmuramoyl-L-alanyl-D-glutamate--2,6-diaminopimelate ligase [Campylobacter sp. RM12327]|uniref:UDP-N-acetylmuramoyl-L-alanyl-D-glutamate--2, 6-diaminopimelate ligase n=1 Tax=Campylobacter sputorum TaxID=206 RepID=UPI000B77FC5A|nr:MULTISPECIES: UDP-N-acetylmuramoyl-L-alanyl-D-glutamate--2,6-diaminopimelate ligase [Campylobacter]ASM40829.1 UDP-N-acetylmuramoylalanyl-D-glutamate 2,6-diaminopimelate ligase [Campylobacter sputorum]MBE7357863.1 UDP-N-acetylmuramoyl-L-alanyl-D-glutamate--2,6-diaminopimelate ligase [Campylobacter sp. RM11302]MBF6669710.1 UDP-N-acetylmuramoyl-L-alanyl-D-glutamate--2,6-diaminopimelate ligase [Campylobacter sp. RM12327]MBF6674853.1 UDP-N-acetylmuramoyl-L-alanyl-D-glutamate--2,6-diaminopimelate 